MIWINKKYDSLNHKRKLCIAWTIKVQQKHLVDMCDGFIRILQQAHGLQPKIRIKLLTMNEQKNKEQATRNHDLCLFFPKKRINTNNFYMASLKR